MKAENNEGEQEQVGTAESPHWSVGSLAWRHWEAPYSAATARQGGVEAGGERANGTGVKEAAPGRKTRMRVEGRIEMSGLLTETARLFGLRAEVILSRSRTPPIARARAALAYALSESEPGLSVRQIAPLLRRSPGVVHQVIGAARRRIAADPTYAAQVRELLAHTSALFAAHTPVEPGQGADR